MSDMSVHNSLSVKSLPFNLSEPKGFKTLMKPLSIKTFPVRKVLNRQNPKVTLDYMDLNNGDTEKKLLSIDESERQNPLSPPKKLTRFFTKKRPTTKQLFRNNVLILIQIKLFVLGILNKLVSLMHSLVNGTTTFFKDLLQSIHMMFITTIKFVITLIVRFTVWKELKWPTEKNFYRNKSVPFNSKVIRKWRTIGGLGVKPLTLVLDLDETLIHTTSVAKLGSNCEPLLIIQGDGAYRQIYLKKRPYLDSFIEKLSHEYNIVIFTAARLEYADTIIDLFDKSSLIAKRLYRESCVRVGQGWIKDIRKVGSDITKTILLDNCPVAGNLHPDNHLLIKPWFGDDQDKELLRFMEILLDYANKWKTHVNDEIAKDIRQFIKKDILRLELKNDQSKPNQN